MVEAICSLLMDCEWLEPDGITAPVGLAFTEAQMDRGTGVNRLPAADLFSYARVTLVWRRSMATLVEELNGAEQAHEALYTLTTIDDAINALSKAREIAKAQQAATSLSSEEALNNSRYEVVIASNNLICSLQSGLSAPDKIEKARRAVEDWVKELRALQA